MYFAVVGQCDHTHVLRVHHHDTRYSHIARRRDELHEVLSAHPAIHRHLSEQRHLVIVIAPQLIEELLICRDELEHLPEQERDAFIHNGTTSIGDHIEIRLVGLYLERWRKLATVRFPGVGHLPLAFKVVLWHRCLSKRLHLALIGL